ncbi:MAG: inositol monophosphatase family protein [Alphaproteobacteria bacterium]|nr:inositol monophosphatase family protein [Alphaproteobacteria bacterium]
MNDTAILTFMHELADEAGAVARRYFRTHSAHELKADDSPVTIADREIEARLRQMIMAQFPDHGILGEEESAHQPGARMTWVIDPIDGTRAFMAGIATFTTLIALCDGGVPVFGLIDQPILKERWISAGVTAMPNQDHQKENWTLATTSTAYFSAKEQAAFSALQAKAASTLHGGDAYLYAMLASGHLDVVVDAGLKPYDFAALVPVVAAHGGIITDWQGKPLTLASSGHVVAARSDTLHQQALDILKSCRAAG